MISQRQNRSTQHVGEAALDRESGDDEEADQVADRQDVPDGGEGLQQLRCPEARRNRGALPAQPASHRAPVAEHEERCR